MHPGEDATLQPSGQAVVVDVGGLSVLFDALRGRGFTVVGPTVRDGAIVVAELASVAELPFGWGVDTEAGKYRLRERDDDGRVRALRRPAVMEERAASAASEAVVGGPGHRQRGSRRGRGAPKVRPARRASV